MKGKLQITGVQSVARENQALSELRCPAIAYEVEIACFIRVVYFVAKNGEAKKGKMDSDLMHAADIQQELAVAILRLRACGVESETRCCMDDHRDDRPGARECG